MTAGSNPSAVKTRMRPQQVTTTPLSISDKLHLQKPRGHRPIGVSLPPGHHLPASGSFINWPPLAAAWRGRGQRSGTFKWCHLKWWHATCWITKTFNNLPRARHCQCILNKALKDTSVTAQTCSLFSLDFIFCCSSQGLFLHVTMRGKNGGLRVSTPSPLGASQRLCHPVLADPRGSAPPHSHSNSHAAATLL